MSFEEYREDIDALDEALLKIVAQRFAIVKKIGVYKKANAMPVLDPERKRQVLDAFEANARRLGLDVEFAQKLYELIHVYALKIEEEYAIKESL